MGVTCQPCVSAIRTNFGRNVGGAGWLTLTAPIKPSMLAPAASKLYVNDQIARYCSLPGSAKERARSVCVHSVRVGRTIARNLLQRY
jgi:hypothetical protein